MYREHFQFSRLPFSRDIPPSQLFLFGEFEELLARLRFCIENRGFAVVTGEVGSGKTTAVRCVQAGLDGNAYRLLYIADAGLTPGAFYESVLRSLGLRPPYKLTAMKHLFAEVTTDLFRNQHRQPVLVVDEAHHLSDQMLEELRFVLNFELDSFSPLALILLAQPGLRADLRLQVYESLAQRITLRYHLAGLTGPGEVKDYIVHQLKMVGCDRPLFTDEVTDRIANNTKGIPRLVNNICSGCLLDAAANQSSLVEVANLERVLAELGG